LLFFKVFTNEDAKLAPSFRTQLSLWGNLVLASLIFNGLTTLLGLYVPEWVAPLVRGYGRRTFVFQFMVMPFLYSVLLALFYFTVPAIAIYRQSFLKAIGRSFRIFAHNPFTSFFLAAIIISVPVMVSVGAERPDVIITKFRPELVLWVLLIGLAVDLVAGFFWMGTAARFLASEET
ncbi:MAG TPA: hypothetical protein VMS71_05755, partial [Candidatus Acidoferrum sp.]|nr:hypothetical protein [Candidatus Acidoferrum sp.]